MNGKRILLLVILWWFFLALGWAQQPLMLPSGSILSTSTGEILIAPSGVNFLPVVNTLGATTINSSSVDANGNLMSFGVPTTSDYGFVVGDATNPTPTVNTWFKKVSASSNPFTVRITGLSPNTQYYLRAYATNNVGEAYGDVIPFSVLLTIPEVYTASAINPTLRGADFGGTVGSDGGATLQQWGICYGLSADPLMSSNPTYPTRSPAPNSSFTVTISNLTIGQTYHFRAFATNSQGTGYGSDYSYTVPSPVITIAPYTVTAFSAWSGGVISSLLSGSPYYGVCWGTSSNVTLSNSINATFDGQGSNTTFYTNMNIDLNPSTDYYARAYAVYDLSRLGDAYYGDPMPFKTQASTTGVTSFPIYNIAGGTATGKGYVSGLPSNVARGYIWSTTYTNTTNLVVTNSVYMSTIADGAGNGPFTCTLNDNLVSGVTYYARAFATTNYGSNTWYGDIVTFTMSGGTPPPPPPPTWSCGQSFIAGGISYSTVQTDLSGSSKCWITQNLGASSSSSFGWGFEYGNSKIITSSSGVMSWAEFENRYSVNALPSSWTSTYDPCSLNLGAGWRLPNYSEWSNVISRGSWTTLSSSINSVLKVYNVGYIDQISWTSTNGAYYWTSESVDPAYADIARFDTSLSPQRWRMSTAYKCYALPVRCIKD